MKAAGIHAVPPNSQAKGRGLPRTALWTLPVLAAVGLAVLAWSATRPGMTGRYAGADGTSKLEFKGSRVYVTTALGTTFVAGYEVDGERVIIKGAGGAQVYTREGDTLDGGVGIRFTRQ